MAQFSNFNIMFELHRTGMKRYLRTMRLWAEGYCVIKFEDMHSWSLSCTSSILKDKYGSTQLLEPTFCHMRNTIVIKHFLPFATSKLKVR